MARHLHFVVFNMILVDGIFFATRTIAHMKIDDNNGILTHLMCYTMITFIIVDILENLQVGNELSDQNNQFHKDIIDEYERDFCKKILPEDKNERDLKIKDKDTSKKN